MVKGRLAKLERAVVKLGAGRCPACRDGEGAAFVTNRWCRDDGTHWDEPRPSEVYDEHGRCRTCGRECGNGVILVLRSASRTKEGSTRVGLSRRRNARTLPCQ